MANPLDRTWYNTLVDDDGSGTTGTIWNKAAVDGLLDSVDASLATVVDKTGGPVANQIAIFNDADTLKATGNLIADPAGGLWLDSATYAYLQLRDNAQPADGGIFRIINANGSLTICALTNAGAVLSTVEIARTGRVSLYSGQLSFPAVQNPSADPYTFDDYREVNWTPTIGGTGGQSGQTYNQQFGWSRKGAGLVTAGFFVWLASKGTISGNVMIRGFPFQSLSGTAGAVCALTWSNLTSGVVSLQGVLDAGTAAMSVLGIPAASPHANLPLSETYLGAGTYISGTVQYPTP